MRNGVLYIVFAAILLIQNGCSHETQLDSPATSCKVRLDIDWVASGIELDGMTAIFYPTDGGTPTQVISSQITGKEIGLDPGLYNIVVFNQVSSDFSYFTIEGMDRFETLRIVMKERPSDWYVPGEGERVAHEPEPFAVGLSQGFEVTEEMVEASQVEGKVFSFACQPTTITYSTKLSIHIKGLYNIKEARATIQNMADTYWITQQVNGTGGITYCFTLDQKTYDEGSANDGILSGSFYSFGPPETATKATTANILNLSILLVDNKTVITKTYDVTRQIEASKPSHDPNHATEPGENPNAGPKGSEIVIGGGNPDGPNHPNDPGNPDDQPIELPDVKPAESGNQGGFDASVDEWGDETDIEIPV